jgi:hypothetical protein
MDPIPEVGQHSGRERAAAVPGTLPAARIAVRVQAVNATSRPVLVMVS